MPAPGGLVRAGGGATGHQCSPRRAAAAGFTGPRG